MKRHSLSEQCQATAKRTGEQCQQWVIGGGPCRVHGGAAPQVRAAREVRILTAEAAGSDGGSSLKRHPLEALLSAMQDADSILDGLKRNLRSGGHLQSSDLAALGDWIDRTSRISKLMLDVNFEARRTQLAEADGRMLAGVIRRILDQMLDRVVESLGDNASQSVARAVWEPAVGEIVPRELRAIAEGSDDE